MNNQVKIRKFSVLIPCEGLHGGSSALVRALDLNQLVLVNQTVRDAHLRVKYLYIMGRFCLSVCHEK